MTATPRKKQGFKQTPDSSNAYRVGAENLTVADKVKVLADIGRPELIEVFKDWKPRQARRRGRVGAPLDQRVSITVTSSDRVALDNELKSLKAAGEKISASQFIRNRALGNVDINGWREIAIKALEELETINEQQNDMRLRKRQLANMIEETDDLEVEGMYERELAELNKKLSLITAQNEKRNNRLTGRMSMPEAETVKWRAQRLCLSSSDYLRMQIFNLQPNSIADAHMSLDSKRRFYISIIQVSEEGFGSPPNLYECSQCANYMSEITRLRDHVHQLESFV